MKRLSALIVVVMLMICAVPISAEGKTAVISDIKAYVNGVEIGSYNIDGSTYIIAENLLGYGFNVYNPFMTPLDDQRPDFSRLHITLDDDRDDHISGRQNIWMWERYSPNNGRKVGDVIPVHDNSTDVFILRGDDIFSVDSYNIDGWSVIRFDELAAFGEVVWHPEERELRYYGPWKISYSQYVSKPLDADADTDRLVIDAARNADGRYVIYNENLRYAADWSGFIFSKDEALRMSLTFYCDAPSGQVGYYDTIKNSVGGDANELMTLLINGNKIPITDVVCDTDKTNAAFVTYTLVFDLPYTYPEDVGTLYFAVH